MREATAGSAIRVMREAQGLTMCQLCQLAGLASPSYVGQVERGERQPSRRWMAAVSDALARNLLGAA